MGVLLQAESQFGFGVLDGRGGREVDHGHGGLAGSLRPGAVGSDGLDLRIGPRLGRLGFPEGLRQEEEQRQQRVHNHNMTAIRRGGAGDLDAVAAIQQASPGAARWNVADYLEQDFLVAVEENRIVGFLVARTVAADEREILNLAVVPDFRRKGVARALLDSTLRAFRGCVFLEVRESNGVAQEFYKSLGFKELSKRQGYYDSPPETAIVMKFHSC